MQVLGATFDGASINRRLVTVHRSNNSNKIVNFHSSDNRDFFFFSDPPHLIKTTRNCWASTHRNLWVCKIEKLWYTNWQHMHLSLQNNGREISWQHLKDLYERDMGKGSGLSMVPKLKLEHLKLTSFSKMRVDLAAQVNITPACMCNHINSIL